ncbi:MAG: GTPase ObgE [Planctomycetota bacterium]|jgi:GTP-binding protein
MLIDRATIFVRAGKGGHGCVSFRREKYVPKGGPDGGDGGDGGDVILVGDSSLTTLLPLTPRPHYRAKNGVQGMGKSMHGANGDDLEVPVPLGTLVYEGDDRRLVADVSTAGQRCVVARGGRGGHGNEHFKSSTNQTPREATPGEPGEEITLRLELKLIADVGLVGKPNAGKSTLLATVTRARPKVADYPFTTLSPHLGIVELPGERRFVMADIPGLIEGAAEGAGLGHDFLRHVERTTMLIHLLDVAPVDGSDPGANYGAIRAELAAHDPELVGKPELIVLSKIDLVPAAQRDEVVAAIASELATDQPPIVISAATGDGVREMLEACWELLGHDGPGWSLDQEETHHRGTEDTEVG